MYCNKCGKKVADNANFCKYCGYKLPEAVKNNVADAPAQARISAPVSPSAAVSSSAPKTAARKKGWGNPILGCAGAIAASCLVGLLIAWFAKQGHFSSVFCAALPLASYMTFTFLNNGEESKFGLILSVVLCVAVPYLADRTAWAWAVMEGNSYMTFFQAFAVVPDLIGNAVDKGTYVFELVLLYIMTGLGAFGAYRIIV